ncbi:uncharacterized protein LOC141912038 [Tubulanus polymorphus]|uniref:uncharacterized protein LOC141912038 n=1 Tax=Tubulanus polymorphus TaxID=672921 RepID=UPI003DA4515B
MVTFPSPIRVTGISSKGIESTNLWVEKYIVDIGNENCDYGAANFVQTEIFTANSNASSYVSTAFSQPYYTKCIKIRPTSYDGSSPGMKLDIMACKASASTTSSPVLTTTTAEEEKANTTTATVYTTGATEPKQENCETVGSAETILNAIGQSIQFTSSTVYQNIQGTYGAENAKSGTRGAWKAAVGDSNPWLIVHYPLTLEIFGLTVLGSGQNTNDWMTRFSVGIGDANCSSYTSILEDNSTTPKIFAGNTDSQLPAYAIFNDVYSTKCVKVTPVEWVNGATPSVRLDALTCEIIQASSTAQTTVSMAPTKECIMLPETHDERVELVCRFVDCPLLVPQSDLLPGEFSELIRVDECCHQYVKRCDPSTCPTVESSTCQAPQVLVHNNHGQCCPQFSCVCPVQCPNVTAAVCATGSVSVEYNDECGCKVVKGCSKIPNSCLYPPEVDSRQLESNDYNQTVFKVGEEWDDGPCKHCVCRLKYEQISSDEMNITEVQCYHERCSTITEEYDVIEGTGLEAGECCQKSIKNRCRPIINGAYVMKSENETWFDALSPCMTFTCERTGGPDSPVEITTHKGLCCRHKGVEYQPGDVIPYDKPCYTALCKPVGDVVMMMVTQVTCPDVSRKCENGESMLDTSGCCKQCVPEADATCDGCQPKPLASTLTDTIGYITLEDSEKGLCTNENVIEDLNECSGLCDSNAYYSSALGKILDNCKCCKTVDTIDKNVELTCTKNGLLTGSIQQTITLPVSCACQDCHSNSTSINNQLTTM